MVLSNLGRLGTDFDFGGGQRASELWFSPPCFTPMGIALGIGTTIGNDPASTLLTFRSRRAQLDASQTGDFADAYIESLEELSSP
jgi:hypothetical protein